MKIVEQIGKFEYCIELVDKDSEKLLMDDGETHSGVCDFLTKRIYIRNDLLNQALEYTIRHELTHAFIDGYGMLQIEWNDEIIADFMAIYGEYIDYMAKKVLEEINKYFEKENDKYFVQTITESVDNIVEKLKEAEEDVCEIKPPKRVKKRRET